jgi:hypothetical protein
MNDSLTYLLLASLNLSISDCLGLTALIALGTGLGTYVAGLCLKSTTLCQICNHPWRSHGPYGCKRCIERNADHAFTPLVGT